MLKLLLALLIPVFTIIAIPFVGFALMYDGASIDDLPSHLYKEDANALEMIYEELDGAIERVKHDVNEDMDFVLHQDIINTAIFNMIREESFNPSYMPTDDCDNSDCMYVFEEVIETDGPSITIRVTGIWVDLGDERVTINVGVEAQRGSGFTYRTTIKTRFIVQDEPDSYHLAFDRFSLGRIPLPKALFSFVITQVDNFATLNLDNIENEVTVGNLDIRDLSYQLPKEDIRLFVEEQGEEPVFELIGELVGVVSENRLLTFLFEEEQFTFTFALALLRNDSDTNIPDYLLSLQDSDGNFNPIAFNPERHLTNRFEEFVFNMALTGNNTFKIREQTLNQFLYHSFDGFEVTRFNHSYVDQNGNVQELTFGLDALWFNTSEENIVINALFSYDEVKIKVELYAYEVSEDPNRFVYDLSLITIGRDEGERDGDYLAITRTEAFKNVLKDVGNVGFGYFDQEGNFVMDTTVITDFFDDGTVEGHINITQIAVIDGAISMDVEAPGDLQDVLNNYTDAVQQVFKDDTLNETLSNNLNAEADTPEEKTIQEVTNIQNKLANDETIEPESVQALFEAYDAMPLDKQQAFINTFEAYLDPTLIEDFTSGFRD